ncbi:hypothetical protein DRF65_17920 [Chryseobacterium pennae]|uniref:Uncharacterized protein n=1 Tax=Chryseobacterium pennae TaxID=2258962 RepID=A0A3D9C4W6_9FLAO|nr:hypothetical protein DRF65_17920 [Chryseobacterium pennae]
MSDFNIRFIFLLLFWVSENPYQIVAYYPFCINPTLSVIIRSILLSTNLLFLLSFSSIFFL